ncbi:TonB-dependent receptor [Eilatimonas milleporae]|uniref:Iron complex outermembrane receptor protein n=1 Tax=Eilatimonas milleporae TaxID=911205 RepID=A0A3M0CE07_9PROT|nr:TonB-dependent receptor [Eilatimonas milleporae]RMB07978.1 iron complex outermembrane receptor protein [Eilatimonas milleporae]
MADMPRANQDTLPGAAKNIKSAPHFVSGTGCKNPQHWRYSASALVIGLALGGMTPATPSAAAQDAQGEADSFTLEEIVVTSRRIEERLTDVPATVSVLTGRTIRDAGIERPEDFIGLTAGVTIVDAAEVGDTQVNIRGINGARDAENSFAFMVDGILYTNPAAFNREFSNLSQIEILKGPQGAIYGRNAAAGAIIVNTQTPDANGPVTGQVEASAANDNTFYANAALSGAIVEGKLAGSIAADWRSSDGFFRNDFLNDKVVDDFENYNINGRLVYTPTPDTTFDYKIRVGEVEGAAISFDAAFALPAFAGVNPAWNQDVNDHEFSFQPNINPQNEQDTFETSLKVEHDMEWATLTAWGLYSDIDNFFFSDGTSGAFGFFNDEPTCEQSTADLFGNFTLPAPQVLGNVPESLFNPASWPATDANGNPTQLGSVFGPYTPTTCDGTQFQLRDQTDISFEIRLAGELDNARWLLGAYYLDIDRQVAVNLGIDRGQGVIPQPFNGPETSNPTEQLVWDDFDSRVFAFFGQFAYDVSDRMELALALRYDNEKREVRSLVPTDARSQFVDFDGDGVFNGGAPLNPGLDPAFGGGARENERTFSELQPKVSLTYDISDDITAFASWGIGFKSGGFNNQGSAAIIEAFFNQPLGANLGISDVFEEETSSAFEVGVKGSAADGVVNFEAAGYYVEVDDMQFFEFLVGSFGLLRVVSNIDEVEIRGLEASINVRPNDWWQAYANANVLDSEINANSARPDTVGNEAPYTPDYTLNIGTQFNLPVNDGLDAIIRADWQLIGPTWFHTVQDQDRPTVFGAPGNYASTQRDSYHTLDMRVGFQSETWSLMAFARNLTNEDIIEEVIPAPEFGGSFLQPGALRRWGIELGYRF